MLGINAVANDKRDLTVERIERATIVVSFPSTPLTTEQEKSLCPPFFVIQPNPPKRLNNPAILATLIINPNKKETDSKLGTEIPTASHGQMLKK